MRLPIATTRQMYIRIFLLLGALFTVLLIVNAIFLTKIISGNAVQEINKFTRSQLNQAVSNTEFTLQRLRLETLNLYNNSYVQSWLFLDKSKEDTTTLALAADQVRSAIVTDPFIHSVYMVNFSKQQVYASDLGLYDFKSFYDPDILDMIQNRRPKFMKFFDHEVNGVSYLALVSETTPNATLSNGYLVILLDKKLLGNHMLQITSGYESTIVMLNNENKMIMGNAAPELAKQLPALHLEQRTEPYFWQVDSGQWAVHYAQLETEGFYLYHLTPLTVWNHNVAQIRWTIVGSTVALLITLLVLIYWNSRKNYKPFGDLANRTMELVKGRGGAKSDHLESAGSDASLLEWGLQSLSEKVDDLNQFVKNNQAIVKEDYLRQWMLSGRLNPSIRRNLARESSIFEYRKVRIAVFRIGAFGTFSQKYDFSSRKLFKFGMGNIMQEILLTNNWYGEVVDMGSDHMVLIIGSEEQSIEEPITVLISIREAILKYLDIASTAAVSDPYDIDEPMQPIYKKVYELTLLRFLHAEERIYEERDANVLTDAETSFTGKPQTEAIIQSIKMKDKKTMSAALDGFMEPLGRLSISECRLLLSQLIYSVMKSFHKWDTPNKLEATHSVPDLFPTIGEARNWLEQQFTSLIDELGEKQKGSRKEEAAAEMIEYISNHFHNSALTVEEIAEHVSMSVGYIYQIFKEVLDTTVADYILSQRIEHVRKLLIATDWTILDIAEQSGFQTKSHFFTAFKKATGMTPNQYRHENRETESEKS